jgi:hypothetical protein
MYFLLDAPSPQPPLTTTTQRRCIHEMQQWTHKKDTRTARHSLLLDPTAKMLGTRIVKIVTKEKPQVLIAGTLLFGPGERSLWKK